MEKLELKHLAPYLTYGLKIMDVKSSKKYELISFKRNYERIDDKVPLKEYYGYEHKNFRILLRPLSQLTQEIEHKGKTIIPFNEIAEYVFQNSSAGTQLKIEEGVMYFSSINVTRYIRTYKSFPYWMMERLLEWHFDVFNLIERGLALEKPHKDE